MFFGDAQCLQLFGPFELTQEAFKTGFYMFSYLGIK
jgi:hypothetical protein